MVMLAVTLVLGLALLSVVDTQSSQSQETRIVDASFALADGGVTSATGELDQTWPDASSGTARCLPTIDRALTAPGTTPPGSAPLADRIAARLAATFGNDAAYDGDGGTTWRIDVCHVDGPSERWNATPILRDARTDVAWLPDRLWVRATSRTRTGPHTTDGVTTERHPLRKRTIVAQLRRVTTTQSSTTYANTRLPADFAILTGRLSAELGGAVSTLSSGQLLSLTRGLLGTNPLIEDSQAKLGVRCALLNLLDGSLCLTGTLGGLGGVVGGLNPLGLGDPLNGLLGTDRAVQASAWSAVNDEELAAYVTMAKDPADGIYRTSVKAGDDCLPPGAAGKVVVIERIEANAAAAPDANKCKVTLSGNATTKARALIVLRGGVLVQGTGVISPVRTFEGIIMATNGSPSPDKTGTSELVAFREGGSVRGAVYVDGGGSVGIYPPNITIQQLLGPLSVVCAVLPCNTINGILNAVGGLTGLQAVINDLLGSYTAVQRDTGVIDAAKIPTPYTGTVTTHRTEPVPGSVIQTGSD